MKKFLLKYSNQINGYVFILPAFLIIGLLWLGTLIGWDKPIFDLGAKPFLLAEIFKILLLALITKKIIKIRNFI